MISECISHDIPPQMKIFKKVIPILMHSKPHKAACYPTKCDVINEFQLFPIVFRDIVLQNFGIIQSDVVLHKHVH